MTEDAPTSSQVAEQEGRGNEGAGDQGMGDEGGEDEGAGDYGAREQGVGDEGGRRERQRKNMFRYLQEHMFLPMRYSPSLIRKKQGRG